LPNVHARREWQAMLPNRDADVQLGGGA
jgi:hypothetical protein